jgi:hypothetical protein
MKCGEGYESAEGEGYELVAEARAAIVLQRYLFQALRLASTGPGYMPTKDVDTLLMYTLPR